MNREQELMVIEAVDSIAGAAEIHFFKDALHDMLLGFFLYHDTLEEEYKKDIVYAYTLLNTLLGKIDKAKTRKEWQ